MDLTCEKINCPYIAICNIRDNDSKNNMCAYAKSLISKENKDREGKVDVKP